MQVTRSRQTLALSASSVGETQFGWSDKHLCMGYESLRSKRNLPRGYYLLGGLTTSSELEYYERKTEEYKHQCAAYL